jgi:integrase
MLAVAPARAVGATFGEWLGKYLKIKDTHWSASNRERERRDHEREFAKIPEFTALPVSAIDQEAKNTALAKLLPSGRRKATSWISAVVNYAQTGVIIQRGVSDETEHHEAMPWAQVPGFYKRIAELDSVDARALRWTILTGARTDEVIGAKKGGKWTKHPATWGEIADVNGQPTWVIPKERMKGKTKMHRVPLTPQMVALLGERQADDALLFKVSSQNAMLNTLKANGGNGYTVHGFRTSFTEYVAAETDYSDDLADRCIAHERRSKVRRAYQRDDLLPKRREIMTRWAAFVCGS